MARDTVEKLIARAGKARTERDLNRDIYEDAIELINPFRNTFTRQGGSHNRPSRQFDSTAMIAANNFVNTMQSDFTPAFSRWAYLKAGPGVPEKDRSAMNKSLEILTDTIFTYLNASNFATAKAEMDFDLGLGTGCMFVLEGDEQRPLNFVSCPISQIAVEEGKFGQVGGVYRDQKVKHRLIKQRWSDATIDGELATKIKDDPDGETELSECIYWDDENLVWYYDVIHEATKERIVKREFGEDIALVPRWLKIPGFAMGLGPFTMALADIKTLNKMKELSLQMAALNAFGVYTVANGGTFNPNSAVIRPGAFIPVERNGGPNGASIQPLARGGDFNIQQFMLEDLKNQIKQVMLDNRLPEENAGVRTAFEIAERIKELQTDIGAAFGRLYFEFVQPLFRRIIAILSRKGLIKLPEGFEIDNFYVQVQVVSPIAQQQSMEDVQKFMNEFQMVQGIHPELPLAAYQIEKIPSWLNEKLGSSSSLLKSEDELKTFIDQLMGAMQQSAQQQPQQQPQ